ncbi:class I adenylate-forming enzyme family protein [Amycolatopsis speibonae]|uniref:Class I adenylate-forming enzyme family protein n=1 Tax=Amycolatopsis speibonae TaxID=1450224 RepID=A0ABV7P311_9PSEU
MTPKVFAATRFLSIDLGLIFAAGAARHPHARIILDHDLALYPEVERSITFTRLAKLVDDLARRMRVVGVSRSDYVAVYAAHRFDLVLVASAAARLGAIPVMLSDTLDGDTVTALLAKLDRPAHLVTDETKLRTELAEHPFRANVRTVSTISGKHADAQSLPSVPPDTRPFPKSISRHEPALVTHSSGTTGLPKLIVQCGRSLYWHYQPQISKARFLRLTGPLLTCTSFSHVRFWSLLMVGMRLGQTMVFVTDPEPNRVVELFLQTQPELIEAYPNVLMRWGELADDPREPLAGVRLFRGFFDAMHPRIVDQLLEASRRRVPLYAHGYGQSEVGSIASFIGTKWMVRRFGTRCVGLPVPGARVKVVRRDGPDQPGSIYVRSRGRALGFIGGQQQYEQRLRDGWWEMGDVGYRGRFGALYLLDREVDHIDGVASTLSIEDTLLSRLPELLEIVVVPSGQGQPTPVLCTKGDALLDPVRWREATEDLEQLAKPVQVSWQDLPVTSTWKIRRPELCRRLAQGLLTSPGETPAQPKVDAAIEQPT